MTTCSARQTITLNNFSNKCNTMAGSTHNNIKLGLLVLAGLFVLISTLYIIGKNENIFGSHFELRARFDNANGLMAGNNIRFSGIQAGTVKNIRVIDDTTIEAVMLIDNAMKPFINGNAQASIGTEGLIGNKVINISPVKDRAPVAENGGLLPTRRQVNTDEMLQTLNKTNENIAAISEGLKVTVRRINNSSALWDLLNERSLATDMKASMTNIRLASAHANDMLQSLDELVGDVKAGKGSVGALLADTSFVHSLNAAVIKIKAAGEEIASAGEKAGQLAASAQGLIKDSAFTGNLNGSLENIRKGTAAFDQDMEALKHNFLLRGYFRRQEKQAKKKSQADSLKIAPKSNKDIFNE